MSPQGGYTQSPYFATGNPETEEMTTMYAPGMLGCVADFDQGAVGSPNLCKYQLVKQNTAISGIVGNVMWWVTKSARTVTTVRTNEGLVAGICQKLVVTAATYIWIAKKGDRPVLFQAAPTVVPDATGLPVIPSLTTDGSANSVALATAPIGFVFGTTLGATAANIGSVRLNVPDTY